MSTAVACRRARVAVASILLMVAAGGAGCSQESAEERNRATAEKIQKKIQESMVDVETIALEQQADAATVEEVQRNLAAINEYQGEISGKLDSVTINAIQAFQRTIECSFVNRLLGRCVKDDGIIGPHTRQQLATAAAHAKQ